LWTAFRGVGLKANGTEIMARSEPDISIESSRKTPEQRHGGLGTAFLDALDVVGGRAGTLRDFSDVEAQGPRAGTGR
jgi:hypothetical protein